MARLSQQSLFESQGTSSLASSVDWINGVLLGELAILLSVIAVAVIGFVALTGRLPLRMGGRVVLGIFILLGAPAIAAAFSAGWSENASSEPVVIFEAPPEADARANLLPANYDPYAGASLRRE